MSSSNDDNKLRQLEQQLKYMLYDITDEIKRLASKPEQIQIAPSSGPDLLVYELLRSYAQQAYQIGIDHASTMKNAEGYLTHADIDAIKQIANDHATKFWGRVNKGIIQKERDSLAFKYVGKTQVDHLSNAWLVDSIASSVVFTAYNQAIKTKAQKITT